MDNKRFYTVTDGMGRMSKDEMNAGYAVANRLSTIHKAKPYTLKKICAINYANKFGRVPSEVTDGMKTYARFTLKDPQHVYVICPEVNSTVESKINMWCTDPERKFKITTIETAGIEPKVSSYTPVEKVFAPKFIKSKDIETGEELKDNDHVKYFVKIRTQDGRISHRLRKNVTVDAHYQEELSDARRCAIRWGQALGWTFSAPLERGIQFIDADYHTYRHRLSVFGAGERLQDQIEAPDIKTSTKESLYMDWWKSKMSNSDNSDAIWKAIQYSRKTLCPVEHNSNYVIMSKGALYMDWWKCKLSHTRTGDPDSIWFAIQCYDRTPQKEQEHDTHYISREDLEAHHAKLSPTRHTMGAFQTEFVRRAPESECEEFFKYYKKLRANANKQMWSIDEENFIFYDTEVRNEKGHLTFYSTDGYHFNQCLEPDWAICPKCGTPYKTVDNGESGGICNFCKTELNITAITRTEQFAVNHALYGDSSEDEN